MQWCKTDSTIVSAAYTKEFRGSRALHCVLYDLSSTTRIYVLSTVSNSSWLSLSGVISEYVNPYIPTHTPEEYWSDHMQTPGWQPTLCVALCLIWWFASFKKKVLVIHDTECPYWDQVSLNNTKPNQTSWLSLDNGLIIQTCLMNIYGQLAENTHYKW